MIIIIIDIVMIISWLPTVHALSRSPFHTVSSLLTRYHDDDEAENDDDDDDDDDDDNDDDDDDNDNDEDDDEQGIRHLGMSPCASENLTVLELDNCPLITDLRCCTTSHACDHDSGNCLIKMDF